MYAQARSEERDSGGGNGLIARFNGKSYPHAIPEALIDAELTGSEEGVPAPNGFGRFFDMLAGRLSFALYRSQFELVRADADELRDLVYQLRYQVYAHENGFEDPSDFPDGREFDAHDDRAIHILLRHRRSRIFVGTARLVLPQAGETSNNFPVQGVSNHPIFHDADLVRHAGEFSRLAISRERLKRCRIGSPWGRSSAGESGLTRAISRALLPQLSAGLIAGVVELAAENGLPILFAAMEPQLIRRLGRIGIRFPFVDAAVEYHGLRHPCVLPSLYDACRDMKLQDRRAWEIVTNRGRSQELALAAQTRTKSAWRAVARAYRLANQPAPVSLGWSQALLQPQWRAAAAIPAITSRRKAGLL